MQISLDDVIAFVRIAKLGSFKEAAEELYVTQSALSRRIKKLEDMLGARLLDRTTRRVSMTVIGKDFLPDAERMIEDFEKSVGDIVDVIQMRAGLVKVATNMTSAVGFGLIPNFQCPLQFGPLGAPLLAVAQLDGDGLSDFY